MSVTSDLIRFSFFFRGFWRCGLRIPFLKLRWFGNPAGSGERRTPQAQTQSTSLAKRWNQKVGCGSSALEWHLRLGIGVVGSWLYLEMIQDCFQMFSIIHSEATRAIQVHQWPFQKMGHSTRFSSWISWRRYQRPRFRRSPELCVFHSILLTPKALRLWSLKAQTSLTSNYKNLWPKNNEIQEGHRN